MVVITGLAVAIIAFIVYFLFKIINRWFGYTFLLLIFIFSYIVSSKEFSVFYILLFLIAIIISEFVVKIRTEQQAITVVGGKFTTGTFNLIIFNLALGLVIYLFIMVISTVKRGNIVGVPDLQITSAGIAQIFKPTFESMLGIIENMFFFVIFDVLLVFGVLIPVVGILIELTSIIFPTIMTAFIAGILHVTAYSVNVGLILWAMIAFSMFLLARFYTNDSLSSDLAHWLNNLVISVQRSLTIVT